MSQSILTRRKDDTLTSKTSVSLGFMISVLTIAGSAGYAAFNYFDNRTTAVEQAVFTMSGDVHQMKGEMDILIEDRNNII